MSRTLLLTLLGCMVFSSAAAVTPSYVTVWLPKSPSPVRSNDEFHFVYELQLTNYLSLPQRIDSIEVRSENATGRLLGSYAESNLANNILRPGNREPDPELMALLKPGESALVFFLVSTPIADPIPSKLYHRINFSRDEASASSGRPIGDASLDYTISTLSENQTIAIGAPLRGGPWIVGNGLSNTAGHRRTPLPLDGRPDFAQRYAIDYVMPAGPDYALYEGNKLANESYFAYGQEVIAVADGVITAVSDEMENNPAVGTISARVPLTVDNAAGNSVIQSIGNGRYASYAHLAPGSIVVAVGDRVTRGQVLARVGNTGNSMDPHLHFHIGDNPKHVLATEGYPYVHFQFESHGYCRENAPYELPTCEPSPPKQRFGEMPERDELVYYP